MTVQTAVNRMTFNGSGTTGPFTFNFRFFTNSDIQVSKVSTSGVVTHLQETIDYTLTGAGAYAGGAITLNVALAVGETLTVTRSTAPLQLTSIRNLGAFFPSIHEDAFDRLTMMIQDIESLLSTISGGETVYTDVGGSGKNAAIQLRWTGLDINGNDTWQLEVITI